MKFSSLFYLFCFFLFLLVVDVVRTDRHLEFYGDAKNMARMSDILAVYAWVDPTTGYCQGKMTVDLYTSLVIRCFFYNA